MSGAAPAERRSSTDQSGADAPAPRARAALVLILPVALFVAASLPLVLAGIHRGRAASDQDNYHLPMIRSFVEQWPDLDFRNYLSATTPGYHVLVAAFARYLSPSLAAMQVFASLFTVALLMALGLGTSALARRTGAHSLGRAPLLFAVVAFAFSVYVFPPGVWLLPDNLGWLLVLGMLLLSLRPKTDALTAVLGAVLLAALVFVRQIHMWAAAPWWLAMVLRPDVDSLGPAPLLRRAVAGVRWRNMLWLIPATLPAIAVVAVFVRLWGGLAPPAFQEGGGGSQVTGANAATPAFILAQVAIISVFFTPLLASGVRDARRRWPGALALAALVGLAVAAIPITSYSTDAGRYSGLWNVVKAAPLIAGRTSPVILFLAPIGAAALLAWAALVDLRRRLMLAAALAAFVAAQSMSHNCWQRYHEPFLLLLAVLTLASASPVTPPDKPTRRWTTIGAALLALAMVSLTTFTIATARPVKVINVPGTPKSPSPGPHAPPDPTSRSIPGSASPEASFRTHFRRST